MRTLVVGPRAGAAIRLVAVAALALLGACTIQLAPAYNQGIVDGLNKANTETMTMFATVSAGVPAATYATREAQYNTIIGEFSALESQVEARPMPPEPSFLGLGVHKPPPTDISQIRRLSAPTKGSLDTVVSTLTKMRDSDARGIFATPADCTVGTGAMCGFQAQYKLNFDSALTYEMALQR